MNQAARPLPPSTSPAWLEAYRETQRHTAEAHAAYQRALSSAHADFLRVMERGYDSLAETAPASHGAPSAAAALPGAPSLPAVVERRERSDPQAAPSEVEATDARPRPPARVPSAAPPAAPASSACAGSSLAGEGDLSRLLLEIVADKTGYPPELLDVEMDVEGDLGIDSIKRVEILAEAEERLPELPRVDAIELGSLRTLGEIATYLRDLLPAEAVVTPEALEADAAPLASPSAEAFPAPEPAERDLSSLLLEIVADKTGYPADLLDVEMDVESDLGIDSIKRVEILAEAEERLPELPRVDAIELGSLRTLGEIAAYLRELLRDAEPGPVAGEEPSEPGAAPQAAGALERAVAELAPTPRCGFALPGLLAGQRPVWVTPDGGSVQSELVAVLRARGVDARLAPGGLPADAAAVIFLGGLRVITARDPARAVLHEGFRVARGLARGGPEDPLLVTVQDTGGALGLAPGAPERAWLGGLPALLKTLARERPAASVRAIDLERGDREPRALAEALADELLAGGAEWEVALSRTGQRRTRVWRRQALRPDAGPLEPGEVVVVSGGARGVTAACVQALAARCGVRLVLLGRTPLEAEPACCAGIDDDARLKRALLAAARAAGEPDPLPRELGARAAAIQRVRELRRTLQALEAAGHAARYERVDVSDAPALARVLARVRAEWGPIRGLVHAAGVLADRRLAEQSEAELEQVLTVKLDGLQALLAATRDDPLRLLCVFSSVAASRGNPGQAAYALANDALASAARAELARSHPSCRLHVLAWGPWAGGMVTPSLARHYRAAGVGLIPLALGAQAFVDELCSPPPGASRVLLCAGPQPGDELERRVELQVDRERYPVLLGHRIQGEVVVPVVLVLEWFARLAGSLHPGAPLRSLAEVRVLRGVRVAAFAQGGERFQLVARSLPGPELALELRDAEGRARYSARAVLGGDPAKAPALERPSGPWSGSRLYDGEVLFHEGAFQVLEAVEGIDSERIAGRIAGVARVAGWGEGPWALDPAALEGGLQLGALLVHRATGGSPLPTGIGELIVHDPSLQAAAIDVTAHMAHAGRHRAAVSGTLRDAEGRPLYTLNEVEVHVRPSPSRARRRRQAAATAAALRA